MLTYFLSKKSKSLMPSSFKCVITLWSPKIYSAWIDMSITLTDSSEMSD